MAEKGVVIYSLPTCATVRGRKRGSEPKREKSGLIRKPRDGWIEIPNVPHTQVIWQMPSSTEQLLPTA